MASELKQELNPLRSPWVSAFILLRLPFSIFLMPVFCLSLNFVCHEVELWRIWVVGLVHHVLV